MSHVATHQGQRLEEQGPGSTKFDSCCFDQQKTIARRSTDAIWQVGRYNGRAGREDSLEPPVNLFCIIAWARNFTTIDFVASKNGTILSLTSGACR